MSPHLIIIGSVFHKDTSKVLRVERDQMIRALTPGRSDQAFRDPGQSGCPVGSDSLLNASPGDQVFGSDRSKFG